ncbi:hypothetical protein M0805_008013 [Coniferiporia weirii]|nr:hypothetical protein M0805_008013 [Coniferiporia weirii]
MQPRLLTPFFVSLVIATGAHGTYAGNRKNLEDIEHPYQVSYRDKNTVSSSSIFSGITTFARLPFVQCLGAQKDVLFDVAFLGAPFDTRAPYRPGARFGPAGIRAGSRRLALGGPYNVPLDVNPFENLTIVDCGDVPVTPYDGAFAIKQIEDSHKELLHRAPKSKPWMNAEIGEQQLVSVASDSKEHQRIITLGGDNSIVLPLLRSIHSAYGAVSVVHFGAHLGTQKSAGSNFDTHFYWAVTEGLIRNGSSVHGAIRTKLSSLADYDDDDAAGFQRIEAQEIDLIGVDGIVRKIRGIVGGNPIYLSVDIDAIDPAAAPATGTPETGGWTTRELRAIIRGLDGLRIVSADIVGVTPAYDTIAETTSIAAADVLFDVLGVMAKTPLGKISSEPLS